MFLGIEIGGTKLQLGVGDGTSSRLAALVRCDVEPARGAAGILEQIRVVSQRLLSEHPIQAIGIGFGGPIQAAQGTVIKSHQIEGWNDFPLANWCQKQFDKPTVLGNDADMAGLAEARLGAGAGKSPVFYITVGTGIGGGLIVGGELYQGNGAGAAEIGHLRPGLHADRADETIESMASGWGIAAAAVARLSGPVTHRLGPLTGGRPLGPEQVRQHLIEVEEAAEEYAADLLERCDGDTDRLTTKMIAQAASDGNQLAIDVLHHAWQALGWGIAQTITLLSPRVVIMGGGVSLIGETLFLEPLRAAVNRFVFPPFLGTFEILPAQLGEEMVVYGALALARSIGSR
jgi:glucokinase